MVRKTFVALAATALACGLMASSASAKHHVDHRLHHVHAAAVAPAPTATAIPGVNPMTMAPESKPVQGTQAYQPIPGVNPMTNAAPIKPVTNAQPYQKVPGVNPM